MTVKRIKYGCHEKCWSLAAEDFDSSKFVLQNHFTCSLAKDKKCMREERGGGVLGECGGEQNVLCHICDSFPVEPRACTGLILYPKLCFFLDSNALY